MSTVFRSPNDKTLLWVIIGSALLVRLWGITYGLPASYYSTEYFIAKDALSLGARQTLEPLQFIYPAFYTYVITALYAVCYLLGMGLGVFRSPVDFAMQFLENPTCFYLTGRLLNALLFVLAAGLFYRTVRYWLPRTKALLLALLFVFSGIFHRYTFWMVPDGLLLAGTVVSLYFLIRYREDGYAWKFLLLGAMITGLTISAKYNAGFLTAGWLAAVWWWGNFTTRERWQRFLVTLVLIVTGFLCGSPYWLLDFSRYLEGLHTVWSQSRYLFEPGSREMFLWEFRAMVQHDALLGVVFIFLLFQSLFRRNRLRGPLVLMALPTFLLVATRAKKGLDYMLIVFPVLLLLAAEWMRQLNTRWVSTAFNGVLLVALLINIPARLYDDFLRTQPDTRQQTREWIMKHLPAGSPICYDHYHYDLGLIDVHRFRESGKGSRMLSPEIKARLTELENLPIQYRFVSPLRELKQPAVSDSLRALVENDPFLREVFTHPHKTLSEIRAEGARLLILNSETYRKYLGAAVPPPENPFRLEWMRRKQFYQAVLNTLPEVTRFTPDWNHPGPEIRIFRLGPDPDEPVNEESNRSSSKM